MGHSIKRLLMLKDILLVVPFFFLENVRILLSSSNSAGHLLRREAILRHCGRWCTTVPEFQNFAESTSFHSFKYPFPSLIQIQPQIFENKLGLF
jgi:hypothetical protein